MKNKNKITVSCYYINEHNLFLIQNCNNYRVIIIKNVQNLM